jgi:polysaccharide deacetylase family protein (PEP-CTERM system associated)
VDVEEFFQASALESVFPRDRWENLPRRTPELVRRLLDEFAEAGALGTFFVLGWLAEREPEMIRAISSAGHEVACHGWNHVRVTDLTPDRFREDLRRSRQVLEDLSGSPVTGYRAPSFSITPDVDWALDVLLEAGFEYDSSLFPVRVHPRYGFPGGRRDPHVLHRPAGALAEIPPATISLGSLNLPAAGGAYLRFFPLALLEKALESASRRGAPGTVYLHPWEFDADMPPVPAPWLTRLRMKGGIGTMPRKFSTLLSRFNFQPMRDTVVALMEREGGEKL